MIYTLTLLLVAPVWAEWVEISQQHYRKPIRTHNSFTTPDKVILVEETTEPWTYSNRSVAEYNWNKNPARTPNIGNVKRVQFIGSTMKTTDRIKFEGGEPYLDIDVIDYEMKPNTEMMRPTKATLEFSENGRRKVAIERVPNIGNVKRVQLNSTPVKSPAVKLKGNRGKNPTEQRKVGYNGDDLQTEFYEDMKNSEILHRRINANKVKKPHGTEKTTFLYDNEEKSVAEEVISLNKKGSIQGSKNYTAVKGLYSTKPTFITETKDFIHETEGNRFYKIADSKRDNIRMFTTELIDTDEDQDIVDKNNIKTPTSEETTERIVYKDVNKKPGNIETESFQNKSGNDEKQEKFKAKDTKTISKANNLKKDSQSETRNEEVKNIKKDIPNTTTTESNKVNTIENVKKFMRVIADTISRNSRRTVGSKMQYLYELKDCILANIEERIDAAWPDDDAASTRRHSRAAHASPRGHHVQFPSSESALMTISFLTFAVFLVKLVLQVIQTYKNKAMMVAPLVVAAGRKAFTHHGHH